jgi:hypothetical protein
MAAEFLFGMHASIAFPLDSNEIVILYFLLKNLLYGFVRDLPNRRIGFANIVIPKLIFRHSKRN